MAPARDQAEERRLDRVGLEVVRGDVPVEVVDRHEGQPAGGRKRLRRGQADQQRPDQAGTARDRDRAQVRQPHTPRAKRLLDYDDAVRRVKAISSTSGNEAERRLAAELLVAIEQGKGS